MPSLALHPKSRIVSLRQGWVAQLVEQRTENPRVGGSIPPPATSEKSPKFGSTTGPSASQNERCRCIRRSNSSAPPHIINWPPARWAPQALFVLGPSHSTYI